MRVQSVNLISFPKRLQSFSSLQSPDTQHQTVPISNLPSGIIGQSLVPGLINPFKKTLRLSYFKLGENLPDAYQKEAAMAIENGLNVLVPAPTGCGKTAVAFYVTSKNMAEGKKTFYTAPLKALSNQKIREFQDKFGKHNVGILTGDIKINPDAPILIMTTEIYTNMLIGERLKTSSGASQLENLGSVIFDEMHYLNDYERGKAWELAMILTPPEVQMVSLSASIGNPKQIIDWQNNMGRSMQTHLVNVSADDRPVKLQDIYIDSKPSNEGNLPSDESFKDLVKGLKKENRVPAIFFVPSKKDNRHLVWLFSCGEDKDALDLTTAKEKKQLQKIIDRNPALEKSINIRALKRGYAMHNAGMLPEIKEIIETLFQQKLIKVVFATETLAAGLNMPAKSVVITSPQKPTTMREATIGDHRRDFTPTEIQQMAGRAGRRGLDKEGFVYFMCNDGIDKEVFKTLYNAPPVPLRSRLSFDYSFIAGCMEAPGGGDLLSEVAAKTLSNYTQEQGDAEENKQQLLKIVEERKEHLKSMGFITEDDTLTLKGKLLAKLNGYEQLPIINTIHEKLLIGMSAPELASCVGMMANASEKTANNIERDLKAGLDVGHDFKEIKSQCQDGHLPAVLLEIENRFNQNTEALRRLGYKEEFDIDLFKQSCNIFDVGTDKRTANHLFSWACYNKRWPVGTRLDKGADNPNWQAFYQKFHPSFDTNRTRYEEGHLFREIVQTIDLLEQIDKMCKYAVTLREVKDKHYYQNLGKTAQEAIELLSHGPCLHV